MNHWDSFYRILGVAEHVIEPTYYHILGVHPKECEPEKIHAALLKKKQLLRQNVPGPQFIPLVIRFEKEQLEPAAETLRDPQKRRSYNKQLLEKEKTRRKQDPEAKKRQLNKVRSIIRESVRKDGTLDKAGKQLLTDRLVAAGVASDAVEQIIYRIPEPVTISLESASPEDVEFFAGAVELAVQRGTLDKQDEQNLYNLASRLSISHQAAKEKIKSQLNQAMLKRRNKADKQSAGPNDSQAFGAVVDDEQPAEQQANREYLPEQVTATKPQKRKRKMKGFDLAGLPVDRLVNYGVPVLSVIVLTLVILLSKPRGHRPEKFEKDKTAPDLALQQFEDDDQPDYETLETANEKLKTINPVPEISLPVTNADRLVAVYYHGDDIHRLLADVVTTLVGCADRVARFTGSENPFKERFESLIGSADIVRDLTAAVDLPVDEFELYEQGPVLSETELDELREQLYSEQLVMRFAAVDLLAIEGAGAGADLLVDELKKDAGRTSSRTMTYQILSALENNPSHSTLRDIVDVVSSTKDAFKAHQAVMTLIRMTGITPEDAGVLPIRHKPEQRAAAGRWWLAAVTGVAPSIRQNSDYAEGAAQVAAKYIDFCKLSAAGAYYINSAAAGLGSYHWPANGRKAAAPSLAEGDIYGTPESFEDLQTAVEELSDQYARLVRTHPNLGKFAVTADIVQLEGQVLLAASDTPFEKLAVNMRQSALMLEIIITENDIDRGYEFAIRKLYQSMENELENAPGAMAELRTWACYKLKLLDLLLKQHNKF